VKITQDEIVDRQTVVHIELEDDDLDPYLDRGYRRVVQRVQIPGFRKGKAPRRIVQQFLGRESLLNEVLDTMLPEFTSRVIEEQELDVAGLPQMEMVDLEPFSFKATVPLAPEIDLGDYKSIRVEETPVEVTEQDIEDRLENQRLQIATWEPVDRPVQMADMVTLKAKGEVEGRTLFDESDGVHVLEEDGTRPFPGFSEQLVGMTADEPKSFTLTVPDDFGDDTISGKEAGFSVTVTEIKERILPELDDEFAKGIGDGFESLQALRESTEEELNSEARQRADQEYREKVVQALLESTNAELPPLIVEHEIAHMEENRERMLARLNVRIEDYLQSIGKSAEEVQESLREDALQTITRHFALSKVAELEDITVSDEEVQERVQALRAEDARPPDDQEVSEEMVDSVRRLATVDKTVDRLVAIARDEGEADTDGSESEQGDADDEQTESADTEGGDPDDTQA
jgi:trigger factor